MERAPINLLGWGAAPKLTTDLLILCFGVRQNPHASTPEAWPQLKLQFSYIYIYIHVYIYMLHV